MKANKIRNGNVGVMEPLVQDLNSKVAKQVSDILEEASEERKAPRTTLVYRVPMAGVRYYF